ncbi:MAG: sugar phosphate nucleotidyltransferase [Bacteriovorax sp.]|nr:sugar phosphate nucleotidyltransferase [Bacteriovorax sp.]
MKGVILAGGLGTRLNPLTLVTNKHLLPIYNKPMIFYPIETLVKAGVTEVMIVTSGPHVGHFLSILKNGKEFGLKHLEYAYQEKPDGGIADALSIARDFADDQPLAVVLGDNTTDADISDAVKNFKSGGHVFLRQVPDPQRYGVAELDKKDKSKIVQILEKPKNPPTNLAVTGLYLYDNKVFGFIDAIEPSNRGELEITDVNNMYIKRGELTWSELGGYWTDAGTFETLFRAGKYWHDKAQKEAK